MGGKGSKSTVMARASRLPGDCINMRNYNPEHTITLIPNIQSKSKQSVAVCRCWKSDRFPMCDNRHQMLMRQGCKVGPAQLEVRPCGSPSKSTTTQKLRSASKGDSGRERLTTGQQVLCVVFGIGIGYLHLIDFI